MQIQPPELTLAPVQEVDPIDDLRNTIRIGNIYHFVLAEKLKYVKDNRLYIKHGFDSWELFMLESDIGIKQRRADQLIEVYEYYIGRLKLLPESLEDLSNKELLNLLPTLEPLDAEQAKELIIEQIATPKPYRKQQLKDKGLPIYMPPRLERTKEGKYIIYAHSSDIEQILVDDNVLWQNTTEPAISNND